MIPDTLYVEALHSDRVHLHSRFWSAILECDFTFYDFATAQKLDFNLTL
jgi:hypothetical protein